MRVTRIEILTDKWETVFVYPSGDVAFKGKIRQVRVVKDTSVTPGDAGYIYCNPEEGPENG